MQRMPPCQVVRVLDLISQGDNQDHCLDLFHIIPLKHNSFVTFVNNRLACLLPIGVSNLFRFLFYFDDKLSP